VRRTQVQILNTPAGHVVPGASINNSLEVELLAVAPKLLANDDWLFDLQPLAAARTSQEKASNIGARPASDGRMM
jgi:hypothetical protein